MTHIETEKKIITDDNKIFRIGSDISFNYNSDKIVCKIKDISEEDNCIYATDVILNGKHISDDVKYLLSCMKDIDFVYYD